MPPLAASATFVAMPGGAATANKAVFTELSPRLSVTVNVTLYVPMYGYVFSTLTPPPVVPSPKSQTYETMEPLGALLNAAENWATAPATPALGCTVKFAVGGKYAPCDTTTCCTAVDIAPRESVTVN